MSLLRWGIVIAGSAPFVVMAVVAARWGEPGSDEVVAANQVLPAVTSPGVVHTVRRPPAAPAEPCSKADCQTVADALEKRVDGALRLIVRPPFVIAGDLPATELERWHAGTIQPAAAAMDHCYFDAPPSAPITVLLFSGQESYDQYARRLFADEGISVYGYYRPTERTLVMNIGTGGGTLVHELTHALIDFDFPAVPEWFNEGLASLHEQCRFRESADGPWIEGLPNWRLAALQEAIEQGRLGSLEQLATTSDFRGPQEALNYAQARYLCLYLQERGLLKKFYRALREHRESDPRGAKTLAALFAGKEWGEVDAQFQAWVKALRP
ncbi:MAG: hypothetical protein U0836_11945 [Pirellulales bacterium]